MRISTLMATLIIAVLMIVGLILTVIGMFTLSELWQKISCFIIWNIIIMSFSFSLGILYGQFNKE